MGRLGPWTARLTSTTRSGFRKSADESTASIASGRAASNTEFRASTSIPATAGQTIAGDAVRSTATPIARAPSASSAETHQRLLATDPEYGEWFEKHETLVFVAQMLVPITPSSMGVSLNPILRDIFFERTKAL